MNAQLDGEFRDFMRALAGHGPAGGTRRGHRAARAEDEAAAPAGLIASGTVNSKSWQLVADRPGTDGTPRGQEWLRVISGSRGWPRRR